MSGPGSSDRPIRYRELTLDGRLRTAEAPEELISEGGIVDFSLLQNLHYTDKHPQGIGGISKINSSALANVQIKSAFQFRKDSPAESNVLVAARDSNGLNQKVYRNGTAIPSAGDFTATALFTDATGYGNPMFSTAPGEKLVYCNGKDTAIWGGSEMRPIGFIDQDPNGTYKYDYTEQVKNALTDSNNIATLHRRTDTADANTLLLLHCDGANASTTFTDDSGNSHNGTAVGNAQLSTAQKAYGTASAIFDGTGDYLTVADHADFNFSATGSDGKATVEFLIGKSGSGCWGSGTYFSHASAGAGTDYMRLYRNGYNIQFDLVIGSSVVATMSTNALGPSSAAFAFRHVCFAINKVASTYYYYLFMGGQLRASTSHTAPPGDYDRPLCIGAFDNGATITDVIGSGNTTYLDEIRISNSARWTAAFDPPTLAYGSANVTTLYVGSQLPLQGVNPYVVTANTVAGAVTGNYWSASGWTTLGTISGVGATPLSASGKNTWTFTSTATTAKLKAIDDKVAYWYRFDITNCDTTTTISQVTLDTPMQTLKELWDGSYRTASSFLVYKSSTFNDYTVNVFEDSWSSGDTASFVELDSLATATDFIVKGFTSRQMGFRVNLIGGHVNTTAGTTATVYNYNGTGPATTATSWTSVGTIDDGTVNGGISFAKSGAITWTPPDFSSEFKVSISSSKGAESPAMYYYKVVFSQNLSADVQLFFVGGIPASEDVAGHKFGVHHLDRLWLWGDEKDPHRGFCTAKDTAQVLRGDDTAEIFLKNTPVAGVSLFERYGSTAANVQLVCEPSRTWAIVGETVENFTPNCIDDAQGCTASLTMDVGTVEILPGTYRRVAIWQSQNAIVMSDGSSVTEISRDIRDKFDPRHANYVGASTLPTCSGGIDAVSTEYLWVIPGVTAWVYDIPRKKWAERPLAATKRIACFRTVYDTNGIAYPYGATSAGFLYRMENGTTIDGLGIPYVLNANTS